MNRLVILGCITACIAVQDLDSTVVHMYSDIPVRTEHSAELPAALEFPLIVTKVKAAKLDVDDANANAARQNEAQARWEKKVRESLDRAELEKTTEAKTDLADNQDALSVATARAAAAQLKKKGLEQRLEQEMATALNLLAIRCHCKFPSLQ